MSTIGNKIHSKIDEYATFIGSNLAKSGIIRIVVMLSFGIILAKDIAMTSGFLTVYGADMVIKVFIVGIIIGIFLAVFFDVIVSGIEWFVTFISDRIGK